MPTLDTDDGIKRYFSTIKDKYPDLTYQDVEKICKSPFYFVRMTMGRSHLPTIMLRYLGKFVVFPSTIKRKIKRNNIKLQENHITPYEHEQEDKILKKILKQANEREKVSFMEIIDP